MKLSEFDYLLPKELIAQHPLEERDKCRLLVLSRSLKSVQDKKFEDILDFFQDGDCLVLNNTKVMPARMFGKRKSGGKIEIFLLEKKEPVCEVLIRPSGRVKEGERIVLESGDEVEVLDRGPVGRFVRFERSLDVILSEIGHIPLPPYIDRVDADSDRQNYQTVYGSVEGATASPTAGLHFTGSLLDQIRAKGVVVTFVTLHTNYGTFAPIKTDDIENHKMHKEYFNLSSDTIQCIRETKARGREVFAVGTTATRVLEWCADRIVGAGPDKIEPGISGYTDLFCYPGYRFKVVDHLITNFHLPKSTLMLLVSAFAGRDFILDAYAHAVKEKYRFFSYGDAMLIV